MLTDRQLVWPKEQTQVKRVIVNILKVFSKEFFLPKLKTSLLMFQISAHHKANLEKEKEKKTVTKQLEPG